MSCPMTKDVPLTSAEIKRFCDNGCSVDCDKLLADHLKKKNRIIKPIEAANGEPIDDNHDIVYFSR
jgi:hypothetical protein